MIFMPPPFMPVAELVKALTYKSSSQSTASGSTHTFSSVDIGSASSDRMVIVGIGRGHSGISRSFSSCTIAGNTADVIVNAAGSALVGAVIVALMVPSGTTATIVVTWSGSVPCTGISVWIATGMSATTANDTGTSTASPGTDTLNTRAGGFAVAVSGSYYDPSTSNPTSTWTNLTERVDTNFSVTGRGMSSADSNGSTSAGTLAITDTWSVTPTNRALAMASW